MNADDLEKRMAQQPLRQVPIEWREEILASAQKAADGGRSRPATARSWWRELLWPSPWAWAGAATVWVIGFMLNSFASGGGDEMAFASSVRPPAVISEMAQSERLSLMKSLFESPPAVEAGPPTKLQPKRRSEGNTEWFRA